MSGYHSHAYNSPYYLIRDQRRLFLGQMVPKWFWPATKWTKVSLAIVIWPTCKDWPINPELYHLETSPAHRNRANDARNTVGPIIFFQITRFFFKTTRGQYLWLQPNTWVIGRQDWWLSKMDHNRSDRVDNQSELVILVTWLVISQQGSSISLFGRFLKFTRWHV